MKGCGNHMPQVSQQVGSPGRALCASTRELFSGYLDGVISGREMQAVAGHLDVCPGCTAEFDTWRGVQQALASAGPVKVPDDLGLRLRLAISRESARQQTHWTHAWSVRWTNLVRPMVRQVSAGRMGAKVLVGTIALLVGVVAPTQAVQANDEPLGALTPPHYLYAAVHSQPVVTTGDTPIVIEAAISEEGRVYDYRILSGPEDAATEAQVRDQLMLLVYEPARAFGQPVRGRVLITFSDVSVKA